MTKQPSRRVPDLVCLSHLRWQFVFQRPQHLMTRFGRDRRVFFVEEATFGASGVSLDVRRCPSGVYVVTPRLPDGEDAIAVQRTLIDQLFTDHEIVNPVLWYYTPMAFDFTRHVSASAVIYDCMDELSHFVNAPPELVTLERELFERADHVFTGGRSLYEHKRPHHASVHAFPSSVDVSHFGQARVLRTSRAAEPSDQSGIPHPRLGFFGVIDERMDVSLVRAIADDHPEWQIVMIGPVVKIDPAILPRGSNVHYLGMKSYEELPEYLAGWDVALLPFAKNDATKFISPTKTPEYLAGGCSVVSTSIRDVVTPYSELDLVRIADTGSEFTKACEDALADDRSELIARADAFLSLMSWDDTYDAMLRLVERAVRKRSTVRKHVRPVYDVVIAGAGFAGSVVAERLAEGMGKRVLICDTRPHIGGNAYDHYDDAGVLVHKYGPHIFHTSSTDVSSYLSRFTEWYPYEHRVKASVDGKLLPIPINLDTVNGLYGWDLDSKG
ncbi:MAG: NAD(P)-binding protein, partial [Clostridia bacterium]|nr:NAD(P)-binding protein [Deltaproteobacteria bacterium]